MYINDVLYSYNGNEKNVVVRDGTVSISPSAFEQSNFESISLPNSIVSIGDYAFCECRYLQSVVLPNKLFRIEKYLFRNCDNLRSVIIPFGVTYIGQGAFEWCYSLDSVVIPNSVTTIKQLAFNGAGITSIVLPQGIDSNPLAELL